jgi:cyclomaltodextrinase / maltogenic alpha-amylase / neopullulanase
MDFNGVYHRANDNYCYPLNENELVINIATGYDVVEVKLIQGDPFAFGILGGSEGWDGTPCSIHFKKRLKNQIWWTTTVQPEFKRSKYYFELKTNSETWYFFEDGFLSEEQLKIEKRSRQFFIFPWMNEIDIAKSPTWVNETIWYQIFPERFCNGNLDNDPEGVLPWREQGSVRNQEFFGGDIDGVIQKLDYLKDLGVNGLYFTPVFLSPTSHKYDTTDYEMVDPNFGTKETLRQLVKEAHNRGMRIMLDGVFNHSGKFFAPWLDVIENGPKSEYYHWFMINQWPMELGKGAAKKKQLYTFAFHDDMPKLNTNHEQVRKYLIDICGRWVEEYGVDAIRLDVANEVSHRFCKELRLHLKKINPEIYILGEIWHDAMPWLRGDEFDSVMNYPLGESIKDFWVDKKLNKTELEYTINRCYTRYMQQTNDVLFNLLDSHDTIRLMSHTKNLDDFYQQIVLLFTMPGSPCIYYGTEIAMEGAHDPDCRRCMPWNEIETGIHNEKIETMKEIIALRKNEPLLQSRNFHFTTEYENPRVIEFQKLGWIDHYIDIIINADDKDIEVRAGGDILFSRYYETKDETLDYRILKSKGILIRKG